MDESTRRRKLGVTFGMYVILISKVFGSAENLMETL